MKQRLIFILAASILMFFLSGYVSKDIDDATPQPQVVKTEDTQLQSASTKQVKRQLGFEVALETFAITIINVVRELIKTGDEIEYLPLLRR